MLLSFNGEIKMYVFAVPASINERLSSGNVAVREGNDITITCSVFGIPQPEVTWYRQSLTGGLTDEQQQQCQLSTGMAFVLKHLLIINN